MIVIAGAQGAVGRSLSFALRQAHKVQHFSYSSRGTAPMADWPKDTLVFLCWPEAVLLERFPLIRHYPLRFVSVSGSLDPKPLGVAVFHPLYGFSPHRRTSMKGVPVGIEGSKRVGRVELARLARSVDAVPFSLPSNRSLYHAAAVTAGAGVLATWYSATRMLQAAGLTGTQAQKVLLPIALQALNNAKNNGPKRALTGPVVRKDKKTPAAHVRALRKARLSTDLYQALLAEMQRLMAT